MQLFEKMRLWYRARRYVTRYDPGGIAYMTRSIQEGQTAFDIGAHKAGYTYFMRRMVGDSGHVVAFEPQIRLNEYLGTVKTAFNWKNVTIESLALSDVESDAVLQVPVNRVKGGSSPSATIAEPSSVEDVAFSEVVSTGTIDIYCSEHGMVPDFIKIDVEGNEFKVLAGGLATLRTATPRILIEIEARHVTQPRAEETMDFILSLGYKGFFIKGEQILPLSEFSFEEHQNMESASIYCNNFVFEPNT